MPGKQAKVVYAPDVATYAANNVKHTIPRA